MTKGLDAGLCITGSFCTHDNILKEIPILIDNNINLLPIFSYSVSEYDTRFGSAKDFCDKITLLTKHTPIKTIKDAEPIGPNNSLDIMIIAPCTGNTLSKLNNAITDTPVLMAAKAHLRNNKPLIIAVSTNDALGNSFKNIAELINKKNIYFVPFGQDNPSKKPNSLISNLSLLMPTIEHAIKGQQYQPILTMY